MLMSEKVRRGFGINLGAQNTIFSTLIRRYPTTGTKHPAGIALNFVTSIYYVLRNMTIILVTGANRGIGFAIVQAAAGKILDATFILGCRSLEAGHEAAQKLRDLHPNAVIDVVQIDIEHDESILAAVKYINEKYGKLDGQLSPCSKTLPNADDPLSPHQQRCRGQPPKVSGPPRCSGQS